VRVVLQRVRGARVRIGNRIAGQIGVGILVLAGFAASDDDTAIRWMADRIAGLRIFPDEDGRMNRSLRDVGGAVLVVSQFTLYGDARKGRRPSFVDAAPPEIATPLYERFIAALREEGVPVETGEFGAMMTIELTNDGPVTLILER
jgi:D-aminoacyl-tRNA deacylase